MADGGGLLLSRVASKGAAQLLDLADGGLVPGPKALNRQWLIDTETMLIDAEITFNQDFFSRNVPPVIF